MKTLKLYNGRWNAYGKYRHCYIAAYNRADAGRLYAQASGGTRGVDYELRDYFSKCWGDSMDGIIPERGLWLQEGNYASKPVRII